MRPRRGTPAGRKLHRVGSPREERIANNEAMFRFANERMADWDEHKAGEHIEKCFCECVDLECREMIALRKADYEAVRSNSRYFLVASGHVVPDVETVIASHDGWEVIEKCPEVTETVQRTDPRVGS
jgi:hypothetical protein